MFEEDHVYEDVRRLAALRQEIVDLGVSVKELLTEDEEQVALEIRGRVAEILEGQSLLLSTLALCEIAYVTLETLEHESIIGFVKAHDLAEPAEGE